MLNDAEYRQALRAKLLEEAREASCAGDDSLLEELGDVYEVLVALADELGLGMDSVQQAAATKARERGRFDTRTWLDSVIG